MDFDNKPLFTRFAPATIYVGWFLLLSVGVFAYWPGLSGPFLLDDFGTLADLGDLGGVKDWITFKAYVFGGVSGPSGRPLALLSFLIDGNNWPTDAWPFKRTNLAIHLLNGALLGIVIAKVLRLVEVEKKKSLWLALLCAACWLLHPFLVSTTLYAVQRMAQLSTMFIFAGIIFYLHGRSMLPGKTVKAYLTMSLALGTCTSLAVLCKENGALLPVLVMVLEFTIFASQDQRIAKLDRRWVTLFLLAPSLLLVAYMGYHTANMNFFENNLPRDFSIYERMLTQSRVLVDYLRHWFVPEPYTSGIFQDHFLKSTGFLSPISTALSTIFHILLIALCVIKRRKWPLFAFAILFFYVGHLLESTVLNLELYFEHRNYLSAAFLFVPFLVLLQEKASKAMFATAVLVLLFVFTGFTRHTTGIWKSYPTIVEASARKSPTSSRAQQQYSLVLFNALQYDDALRVTDTAIEQIPDDEQLYVWRSIMLCNLGLLTDDDFEKMKRIVVTRNYDLRALGLYTALVNSVTGESCPAVSLEKLRTLFTGMLDIPMNADPRLPMYSQIKYFIGTVDIHLHNPQRAIENFIDSLQARPGAGHAMQMAALMASSEFYDEALLLSGIALAELKANTDGLNSTNQINEHDIIEFRKNVQTEIDISSGNAAATSGPGN
jgi:hypothetical protein